jgi:hypothetical protein
MSSSDGSTSDSEYSETLLMCAHKFFKQKRKNIFNINNNIESSQNKRIYVENAYSQKTQLSAVAIS